MCLLCNCDVRPLDLSCSVLCSGYRIFFAKRACMNSCKSDGEKSVERDTRAFPGLAAAPRRMLLHRPQPQQGGGQSRSEHGECTPLARCVKRACEWMNFFILNSIPYRNVERTRRTAYIWTRPTAISWQQVHSLQSILSLIFFLIESFRCPLALPFPSSLV